MLNNDNNEYKKLRLEKLEKWNELQGKKFIKNSYFINTEELKILKEGEEATFLGRIMLKRFMGKIAFLNLQDFYGNVQIVLNHEKLGEVFFKFIEQNLDIGDIISVSGEIFTTKKGEKSLKAESFKLLTKSLLPFPEKQAGIVNEELKLRKRYLDLLINKESQNRFKIRNKVISFIRRFLENNEYIEVETPILQAQASGALATPFKTHHKSLDMNLYLRIAPETYLKRLMTGGYEKIFEIGKSFRNEGVDPSHLQEFTMLEFYTAYSDYADAILFVEELFKRLFKTLEVEKIVYSNQEINLAFPWKKITYKDLFFEGTGLDLEKLLKNENLFWEEGAKLMDLSKYKSVASAVDGIYKKYCRPNLIDPIIITHQPAILGPLAKVSEENSLWSDRFQVVINGWEVVNAYSELTDPLKQKEVLLQQAKLAQAGEEEAMVMEDDFIEAMEYGMPPMAGVGIGLDRIIALLTDAKNLRDVVFFPNLK